MVSHLVNPYKNSATSEELSIIWELERDNLPAITCKQAINQSTRPNSLRVQIKQQFLTVGEQIWRMQNNWLLVSVFWSYNV